MYSCGSSLLAQAKDCGSYRCELNLREVPQSACKFYRR
jgi:hypothetical protein